MKTLLAIATFAMLVAVASASPTSERIARPTHGEIHWQFNPELLAQLGLRLQTPHGGAIDGGKLTTPLVAHDVEAAVAGASLAAWHGGTFAASPGFLLVDRHNVVRVDLSTLQIRPRAGATTLDLVDDKGRVQLTADAVMAALSRDRLSLDVAGMNVRLPDGLAIGDAQGRIALAAPVPRGESSCAVPHWPGSDGGAYVADITLDALEAQAMRCGEPGCTGAACTCDGPGGTDAAVVVAATARLSNTDDDNGGLPCTAADPCSADVPWNPKFAAPRPPYGNDQHPFLIWNLYRLDPDGRIAQIGRSGVKHAFVALNTGCACEDAQTLGRGCGDVYAAANNDNAYVLGPRSEIDPVEVRWGRCGAADDDEVTPPNPDLGGCDGVRDASGGTPWRWRLTVRESQIDPALHPGSRWLFEAWYLVRGDADADDAMGTIEIAPQWNGQRWGVPQAAGTTFTRGPAIAAWAAASDDGPMQRSRDVESAYGNARLSVRVRHVAPARWRYDYALMNVSVAHVSTAGAEPNLRVVANPGFTGIAIPLHANASVRDLRFDDGDLDASNDWPATRTAQSLHWETYGTQTLDWGTLFFFSLTATAPPVDADVDALVSGAPPLRFASLAPDPDSLFADGFEQPEPGVGAAEKTHGYTN